MWNLAVPPGFQGLREDLPLDVYIRHLPHWRQQGATYFVTFRLADSLPQVKLAQLQQLRREWEQRYPPPWSKAALEEFGREAAQRIERWLDQGMGSCVFKDRDTVTILRDAMLHFDGDRYELGAFAVMPNHVHALVRPLLEQQHPLETIVGSWKQFSAGRIHQRLGGEGALWQDEAYDRIVRDGEHLYRCVQYIGRNLKIAGLEDQQYRLWLRPQWWQAGWRFDWDVG